MLCRSGICHLEWLSQLTGIARTLLKFFKHLPPGLIGQSMKHMIKAVT
jgi:hypothetical protein